MLTLDEFKALNVEKGYHWFAEDTMKFWNSKIHSWDAVTGYFVTKEDDFERKKRLYSIRKADFVTGQVSTIEFQKYNTWSQVVSALRKINPNIDARKK